MPAAAQITRCDGEDNGNSDDEPDGLLTPGRTSVLFNVAVTAIDVGVALVAFQLARHAGASDAVAYFAGSVGPLLGSLAVWLRARTLSGASIAILAFTALSAVAALAGSRNADALLFKDAVVTGLVGLTFAASMLFPRPLAFYFGQRYLTDGTHAGMADWAALWRDQSFRRANYAITAAWAASYLLEAAGKAYVIHTAVFTKAYTWTQLLPWVAATLATLLTIMITRHYSRAEPTPDPLRSATQGDHGQATRPS